MTSLFEQYINSTGGPPRRASSLAGRASRSPSRVSSASQAVTSSAGQPAAASTHSHSHSTPSLPPLSPMRSPQLSSLPPLSPPQAQTRAKSVSFEEHRTLAESHSMPGIRSATSSGASSPATTKRVQTNPRLNALAQFRCTNPTCLHALQRSRLRSRQPLTECPHQQNAHRIADGRDGEELSEALDLLDQMESQAHEKKLVRRRLSGVLRHRTPSPHYAALPSVAAALTALNSPLSIDQMVGHHVLDSSFKFDESVTPEAKRAREVLVWAEGSAKVFSVCELPFLHPPDEPSPHGKRSPIELQRLQRTARARDMNLLGQIFSFLPTRTLFTRLARVNHMWRVCAWHDLAWDSRAFHVGDLDAPLEVVPPSGSHDGHIYTPTSVLSHIRRLPRAVRDKVRSLVATTRRTQLPSDMGEFNLDHLLLFPHLTRLTLEVGAINGGATVRQQYLNGNRMMEDVVLAKQLREVRHFHLDSNPVALSTTSALATNPSLAAATLTPVLSESRAAQWLRHMIPYWELVSPPSSISGQMHHVGLLTIDMQSVLFHGCWLLRVLERAQCNSLQTLALTISFAAPNSEKISAATISDPHDSTSTRRVRYQTHHAATLSRQRLADLFVDARVIPPLFHSFSSSLRSLTLHLENDKVLARERITESTAFLIFMPLLKSLRHLRIKNLKLANEGGSVTVATTPNERMENRTPPIHSALFHVPRFDHLQRVKRLDIHRFDRDWSNAWSDGVRRRRSSDEDSTTDDSSTTAESESKQLKSNASGRDGAGRLRRSSTTDHPAFEESKASAPSGESSSAAGQPAFTTLCTNDMHTCRCVSCAAKLHGTLSTFSFMAGYLSQLPELATLELDDLAVSDFARVTTTTTKTTTTTILNKEAAHGSRRQVSSESTMLRTTATIAFAPCTPLLMLSRLASITLPLSSNEYDPTNSLIDAVCAAMGSRLRHLGVIVYGNGWMVPENVDEEQFHAPASYPNPMYTPMPLVIYDDIRPKMLPFPRLKNLYKLSSLVSFSVRRDTTGLSAREPDIPLLPIIQTLSIRTSPLFVDLTVDGFSIAHEKLWQHIGAQLGGTAQPASRPRRGGPAGPSGPSGLRSLSLHNYSGVLTDTHLSHLASVPHLERLSIGVRHPAITGHLHSRTNANELPTIETANGAPPRPAPREDDTAAPTIVTPPLSEGALISLSHLLPSLQHIELSGQEHVSAAVLRHWSQTTPVVQNNLAPNQSRVASATSSVSPAVGRDTPSPDAGRSSSSSTANSSVTSRPPFPRLTSVSLLDCRPLGYSGLIELARAKLHQLDWIGLEYERRKMQPVQAAIRDRVHVDMQFRKAGAM